MRGAPFNPDLWQMLHVLLYTLLPFALAEAEAALPVVTVLPLLPPHPASSVRVAISIKIFMFVTASDLNAPDYKSSGCVRKQVYLDIP